MLLYEDLLLSMDQRSGEDLLLAWPVQWIWWNHIGQWRQLPQLACRAWLGGIFHFSVSSNGNLAINAFSRGLGGLNQPHRAVTSVVIGWTERTFWNIASRAREMA